MKPVKTLPGRSCQAALGLIIFTFGDYLAIQANIGLAPWDCLNIGLAGQIGLSYGQTSILVSLVILGIDLLLRERIGIGTILDTLVCGIFLDVFMALGLVPACTRFLPGAGLMLAGMVFMALGQWIYMRSALCCGPRDSLLVGVGKRLRKLPIGLVEILILLLACSLGFALGGKMGLGTLFTAFGLGLVMQLVFRLVRFEPRDVVHEDLIQTLRQTKLQKN